MTDDDDLFEREMASMGLGPSASSIRAREDRAFIEEVAPAERDVVLVRALARHDDVARVALAGARGDAAAGLDAASAP